MGGLHTIINTAVTGVTAQTTTLGVISDNIANSQTIGYKNTVSRFGDLVAGGRDVADMPTTTGAAATGGTSYVASGVSHGSGVTSSALQMVSSQGILQSTGTGTNLGISGRGFFETRKLAQATDSTAESFYTRAGDFSVDQNGYLVNSSGFALLGVANPEPQTSKNLASREGNSNAGSIGTLVPVKVSPNGEVIAGSATTSVTMPVNLPADTYLREATVIASRGKGGTAVYVEAGDTLASIQAKYPNQQITADKSDYEAISARGGAIATGDRLVIEPRISSTVSMAVYGASGNVYNVTMEYRKVFSSSTSSTNWDVRIKEVADSNGVVLYGPSLANGGTVTPLLGGPTDAQSISFDSTGKINGTTSFNFGTLALNGADSLSATFDMSKVTQTGDQTFVGAIEADGRPAGSRSGLEITDDGYVVETFSNGIRRNVYRVPIADFRNPEGLDRETGTVWTESLASGDKRSEWPSENGVGHLTPETLETSTTDMSVEFTNMILTQRAYSANVKVVTTGDEMYQEAIQMKR